MEKKLHYFSGVSLVLLFCISLVQPFLRAYHHLVNPDVAYHYLMGKYITMGQKPYIDFVDMNFPTIWYLSTIPSFISSFIGHDVWVIITFFSLITVASFFLLKKVLYLYSSINELQKFVLLALFFFTVTAFQQNEFGQREHLFAVCFLPLLFLKALPDGTRRKIGNKTTFMISFLGSYIVWVKPHYVILYLLMETFFAIRERKLPRGAILYGQIAGFCVGAFPLLLFLPEYLSVAEIAAKTYTPQTINPNEIAFTSILGQRGSWFVYLAITLFIVTYRQQKLRYLNSTLIIATILTWFVAIAQNKAYPYHIKPASTLAILSLVVSTLRLFETFTWFNIRKQTVIVTFVVFALCVRTIVATLPQENIEATSPATAMTLRTIKILTKNKQAKSVFKVASSAQPLYPGIITSECMDITGINSFWYLGSFYRNLNYLGDFPYHKPHSMSETERTLFYGVIERLIEKSPDIVILDKLKNPAFFDISAEGFNFYDYYAQDNRFKLFMQNYTLSESADGYEWYTKKTE